MILGRVRLLAARIARHLWVTPTIFALGTLAMLLAAPLLEPLVPARLTRLVPAGAVEDILRILGSSMLAVAIFSVGTMVQALEAAAAAGTPRARPLITADRTAQAAISTFIGGFVFAILSLVGLSGGGFDGPARVVIFAFTIIVILVVIVTLIAWIDRLSRLGGVTETISLIEETAEAAFADRGRMPHLGGRPSAGPPGDSHLVHPDAAGFLQLADLPRLAAAARDADADLHLLALPGAYVEPSRPIVAATRTLDPDRLAAVRGALVIGPRRSFERDPRYGLIVLSEVASRALSPAVHDPGTAIEVIGAAERLIADWRQVRPDPPRDDCARVFVPALDPADVIEDAFRWIARDGAGQAEVMGRLLKALARLAAADPEALGRPCRALAAEAMDRAARAMTQPSDLEGLRMLAHRVGAQSARPPA